MRALAIVPARGGSKGIPRKNLQEVGGYPLLAFSIAAAKSAGIFQDIVISSEDAEINEIAMKFGATLPFSRPVELALDDTPMIDVIQYTVNQLKAMGKEYDVICLLQPTTPFRDPELVAEACHKLMQSDITSVVGVTPCIDAHPKRLRAIKNGFLTSYLPADKADNERQQRQSHSDDLAFRRCGAFYCFTPATLSQNSIYGNKSLPIIVENAAAVTIDEPLDLLLVNAICLKSDEFPEAQIILKKLKDIYE